MKNEFHIILVVIYVTLHVKPLKKCIYFWVPIIACPKLTFFLSITQLTYSYQWFQRMILDIILPLGSMNKSSLLSLEILSFSIFWAYILVLRVYFSQVSCLFFKPTSSLCEYNFVRSLVYCSILHPPFASIFFLSILSIF